MTNATGHRTNTTPRDAQTIHVRKSLGAPKGVSRIDSAKLSRKPVLDRSVLTGAKSFAEIAEWAADTGRGPLAKAGIKVPHVTTIQRVLARVDGDIFDIAFGAWIIAQVKPKVQDSGHGEVIAVDIRRGS